MTKYGKEFKRPSYIDNQPKKDSEPTIGANPEVDDVAFRGKIESTVFHNDNGGDIVVISNDASEPFVRIVAYNVEPFACICNISVLNNVTSVFGEPNSMREIANCFKIKGDDVHSDLVNRIADAYEEQLKDILNRVAQGDSKVNLEEAQQLFNSVVVLDE